MSKAQFQAHVRGKGFTNFDPGYSEFSRTREKFQDDLTKVKDQQRKAEIRDEKAEANLERVMRDEEANRKDIFIEDKVISTRERALDKNRSIETENFKAKQKEREQKLKDFKSILDFSETAVKSFAKIQQDDWDATAAEAQDYYLMKGLTHEEKVELELIENKIVETGKDFNLAADNMAANGYTHEEVRYVRGKGKASDYGQKKAYAVIAGNKFGAWAQEQLAVMKLNTTEEKQAALKKLRQAYLQAHGLDNVSSDFLSPMFEKMRAASDKIINGAKLTDTLNFYAKEINNYTEELMAFSDNPLTRGNAVNNLYDAIRRSVKPNGMQTTAAEAKQQVFEILSNIDNFPSLENVLKSLDEAQFGDQNTSWSKANQGLVRDLILKRTKARKLRDQNTKLIIDAKKKEELDSTLNWISDPINGWNGDVRVLDQVINTLENNGHTTEELSKLLPYRDQSIQGRNDGDYHRKHINELIEDNRLTTADLTGPFVPHDLKKKHWKKAAENEAIFKAAKIKQNVLPAIEDELLAALKLETIDKTTHSSFNLAKYHAETEFRGLLLDGVSAEDALTKVLTDIQKGRGKFNVVNHGDDGHGDDDFKHTMSFFGAFVPGSHKNALKLTPTLTRNQRLNALNEVIDNPKLIRDKLYIKEQDLIDVRDNILAGKSYRLPQICFDLSQAHPEKFGSPYDVWTNQLDAADLDTRGLDIDDFMPTLFRDTTDPTGEKMIKNLRTKIDARKIMQTTYNPSSVRDPRFMSPNVNKVMERIRQPQMPAVSRQELKNDETYRYVIKEGPMTGTFTNSELYEFNIR